MNRFKLSQNFQDLFRALILGVISGLVIAYFFKSLYWVQNFQRSNQYYILLLPIVWLILKLTKRYTLYFPVSFSEAYLSESVTYKYWNKLGVLFNFGGSVLSHFSGASIGREAIAVTLSSTLAQLAGLDWTFWRSIVLAGSFGIATGSPWVGLVLLFEVFSTNINQKLLTIVMAWAGCLVFQNFHIPHLIQPFFVLGVNSYFEKLFFVFVAAAIIGLISRFYKTALIFLEKKFKKSSIWILFLLIMLVSIILFQPQYKDLHSLSLQQFEYLANGHISAEFILFKIMFTIFFVSVGFWGGDFVPSVLIGSGLGVILAKIFSIDPMFGLMLGAYSFFCGLTRLKWTALVLTALLVGYHQLIWVYVFLTVCRWFAGNISLYTTATTPVSEA
jgi:H+/Cl- antiporter ClcA